MGPKSLADGNSDGPRPFSWAPSGYFDGNDGSWSTFVIRVGAPPQTFRVLPSTVGPETWVPAPEDCALLNRSSEDCGSLRGVDVFDNQWSEGFMVNKSSSWDPIGLYELGLENNLNYTGNGRYGFDTIGLEIQNSGGLTLSQQIVAGTVGLSFMLGIFGLSPTPTNFKDSNDPQPSYLWSLKNQSLIPSLSYAYSSGASYREKGVFGSLTLGGYDSSRFLPNNQTFTFSSTISGGLAVGIQSIKCTNTLNGVTGLLPTSIFALIDSTIPEIWLPIEACSLFESSFGLIYDSYTDRYRVNDSIHTRLQSLNPTLTFQLANDLYGDEYIQITLPYASFDLQASYPIYPNATNYFPLRRAANESQYTIGRTFLQESYLTVDYERSTFKISQSTFSTNISSNIIAIPPLTTAESSGLSHSNIVDITVGSIVAFLLILGSVTFPAWRRRQSRRTRTKEHGAKEKGSDKEVATEEALPELQSPFSPRYEVPGSEQLSQELDTNVVNEMNAVIAHEIGDGRVVQELDGTKPVTCCEDSSTSPIPTKAG